MSNVLKQINNHSRIPGVYVVAANLHRDERGMLMELFRLDGQDYPAGFPQPVQGYFSITKPGVSRGPHEHKFQSDYFVFPGPGRFALHLWDRRLTSRADQLASHEVHVVGIPEHPMVAIIPPGVVHGYVNFDSIDAMSINLPNKLFKGYYKADEVDETRWENRPDNYFHMNSTRALTL